MALVCAGNALFAARHDVTYKGTVVAVDAELLKVSVINEKTKKPETIVTRHDKETKFLRGDKLVTFAEAKIRPKERVTVTFNNDEDANFLSVVRLDPIK
jgi:hypothetical protein